MSRLIWVTAVGSFVFPSGYERSSVASCKSSLLLFTIVISIGSDSPQSANVFVVIVTATFFPEIELFPVKRLNPKIPSAITKKTSDAKKILLNHELLVGCDDIGVSRESFELSERFQSSGAFTL